MEGSDTMKTQHRIVKISRLGLVLLLAGVMAAAAPKMLAQTGSASKLQTEVASKLSHDKLLQGQNIMVNANGSQITLSGTVATQQQWQEAESVTANVSGVRTILNDLRIAGQGNASQGNTGQAVQSQNSPAEKYATESDQMAPPPPPDAAQPQEPPTPATPANGMSEAGNPPPPPPDQANQTGQNSGQQARPSYQGTYQGNGYRGQSYGAGYGSAYGAQNPQNGNQYNNESRYAPPPQPSGPVAVPAGTLLQIRTVEPLDSAHLQPGEGFDATVARDVWQGNVLAIPRGATVMGVVVEAKQPQGKLGGKPHMDLQITSLNLGGRTYRLDTNVWSSVGPNKAGYTVSNTATGGLLGAIIGGIIGRGAGAAVGAGVGAMAGLGASSATKGPHIYIPSEAVLNFHLNRPVTVQPVSWEEARRMAENVPQLQTRPGYGRRYPRPYSYGYASPPPYYYGAYPYYGPSYYFGLGW